MKEEIIEQLIRFLTTPIARREGIIMSKEDCAIWADELKKCIN